MLKRKIYDKLKDWKNTKINECLLVKGARQVGKSYIIDYFGKIENNSILYVDVHLTFNFFF